MDALIQHLQVTTTPVFDVRGRVKQSVQYSYYVGDHGPFTDVFPVGEDTRGAVLGAMDARIQHLRDVGAIPA
jgi:hypothetical protein